MSRGAGVGTRRHEPEGSVLTSRLSGTFSGDETTALAEFDNPPSDPITLLRHWIASAIENGVHEPLAVSLATVDAKGHPTNRIVLVKGVVDGALAFTSHTNGRKGQHLADTPYAAMNFYWRETLQQITLDGLVEPLSSEASDILFAERAVAAQAATAVSRQGLPLADEEELRERAQALIEADEPIERPAGWGGYRLLPRTVEFWHGRESRLHRRLSYSYIEPGWTHQRLQP